MVAKLLTDQSAIFDFEMGVVLDALYEKAEKAGDELMMKMIVEYRNNEITEREFLAFLSGHRDRIDY